MELEDVKHVVHLLHTALHLPEHHLLKERQLLERLDNLKQELSPLEKVVDVSQHLYAIKPHFIPHYIPLTVFSLSTVLKGTGDISILLALLDGNLSLLVLLPDPDR